MSTSLRVERRADEWVARLRKYTSGRLPAGDLYSGDHWRTVRSVLELPSESRQPVRVWVCSAGYGLVPIDAMVSPYSATFTPGDEDSVCAGPKRRTALPIWWATLSKYAGVHSGPRTITELAVAYPDDFLLVALPDSYVTAVADDLRSTVAAAGSANSFAVLSVGGTVPTIVEPYLLPANVRLQRLVGGSLTSLNARLARMLVSDLGNRPLTLGRCRRKLVESLAEIAPATWNPRAALTDGEVKVAILQFLIDDPKATNTPLLKRLRESGRACEQSRFATLFRQVKRSLDARA